MNRYGTIIAPNTMRSERLLPGPIERVWSHLADPGKRSNWPASRVMDLHVGGGTTLHGQHSTSVSDLAPEVP